MCRAEERAPAHERGNGQRKRVARDGIERGKTAVVDLLLAAGGVEFDDLHGARIGEVGDGRVVEGDVSVFADAETNDVDRRLREQGRIARALRIRIVRLARDAVKRRGADAVEHVFALVVAKARGMIRADAGVFVHVEKRDARPVHGGAGERVEQFVLRWRAG